MSRNNKVGITNDYIDQDEKIDTGIQSMNNRSGDISNLNINTSNIVMLETEENIVLPDKNT